MNTFTASQQYFRLPTYKAWREIWLLVAAAVAIFTGRYIADTGIAGLAALIAIPMAVVFVLAMFFRPKFGFVLLITYCFVMPWLGRHFPGQFGLLIDGMLLLIFLSLVFWQTEKYRWRHVKTDLFWLSVAWMVFSVFELANPSRPSAQGWLQEVRGMALYWVFVTPIAFLLFNRRSDVGFFLHLVIILSAVAALYGIKQLYLGVDGAENAWLEAGAKRTHILFGKLRVFSFYFEAAQFGASQGQVAIMCFILATGTHTTVRRIIYLLAGLIIFYGMLISGTRGAMGALIGGAFVLIVLSKQFKIIIGGVVIGLLFISFLKFTTLANNNDQIRRLRSSTDANDPSLQIRLANQQRLGEYLVSRPFGTGVGTIGMWGVTFNKHIPTASIPPDSMFVKVWVQYGVVGFTFFLSMMLYIAGKSMGIIWRTKDKILANQLTALAGGSFGALVCSYGNEVMNQMPTSIIVYISWVLIWLSPRWQNHTGNKTFTEHNDAGQHTVSASPGISYLT